MSLETSPVAVRSRWLRPATTVPAAVGVVFLVAGAVQLGRKWPAVGDFAVAELIVRHLGRHLPLSGPYSAERGYDHPLPWVYALEWVPYRVFGDRSAAAPAMALWWNGVWASVVVWLLARRHAIELGLLALATLLILAVSVEGVVLLLPWNPDLAVVPACALLFVSWRVAIGEGSLLPLGVGLAVWCTGAHLGFLPFATALVATSVVSLIVVTASRAGARDLRSLRRPVLLALAVAAILTSPMVIDLVLHGTQSNPARIVKWLTSGSSGSMVPAAQAVKVFRAELAIPPAWTRMAAPYDVLLYRPAERAPLLLVLVAIAVVAAWRRRAHDELIGIGLSFVGLGAATFGLIRVDASMLAPWYILPAHLAGAGLVAFVVWSIGRSIGDLVRNRRASSTPTSLGRVGLAYGIALPVLCVVGTAFAVADMHTPAFQQTVASTTARLAATIEQRFPRGARIVVDGPLQYDGYFSQSLTLQLDRAGYAVRVPNSDLFMYTDAFAIPKRWGGTTLQIGITGPHPTPPEPHARVIASVVVPPGIVFAGRTISVWERAPPPVAR